MTSSDRQTRTDFAGRTEHGPEQPHPLRFGAIAQAGALLTPVGEAKRIGSPEVLGGAAAAERLPLRRGRSLSVPAWRRSRAPESRVPTRFTETWVGGRPTSADRRTVRRRDSKRWIPARSRSYLTIATEDMPNLLRGAANRHWCLTVAVRGSPVSYTDMTER